MLLLVFVHNLDHIIRNELTTVLFTLCCDIEMMYSKVGAVRTIIGRRTNFYCTFIDSSSQTSKSGLMDH